MLLIRNSLDENDVIGLDSTGGIWHRCRAILYNRYVSKTVYKGQGFRPGRSIQKTCILECWFNPVYLTFAEGMDTLCGTLSPLTALSMKRNTKKLPSIPAVKTYLSSKLVLMCRMPPWWLSCTLSAQNELKCSKSFDPSKGWIRRTPLSIPRRTNLPEWLKNSRGKRKQFQCIKQVIFSLHWIMLDHSFRNLCS